MEIVEGQFIQPFLVGRRLELNPVAVVLAIWLFGALWGLAGVILSVPLLLALKATASQVDALHLLLPIIGSASAPAAAKQAGNVASRGPTARWRRRILVHPVRSGDEVSY